MAKAQSKREVKYKWQFAIGTTSRVPHSKLHYFIADFDGEDAYGKVLDAVNFITPHRYRIQKTQNGFHFYSNKFFDWKVLLRMLKMIGADPSWIRIGRKRGYLFLADKDEVQMSWPVERMALRWDESAEKKALHRT